MAGLHLSGSDVALALCVLVGASAVRLAFASREEGGAASQKSDSVTVVTVQTDNLETQSLILQHPTGAGIRLSLAAGPLALELHHAPWPGIECSVKDSCVPFFLATDSHGEERVLIGMWGIPGPKEAGCEAEPALNLEPGKGCQGSRIEIFLRNGCPYVRIIDKNGADALESSK
jgi:hypothetical protein